MATAITTQTPLGPHPAIPISVGALDFTFANGDTALGNEFVITGRQLLLVFNNDVGAQTFTISSVPDAFGRKGDITDYSLDAGDYVAFWFGSVVGWRQTANKILLASSNDAIQYAVLNLD
ncbi:hypothetical protein LCGC14_1434240 [marine sediment metagenome]|uniref:Uncharacterized protein n=1 Tax=marine sediment metagenome TaxID=412755 RepID=A0A0F9M361_9ZZZZ